MRSHLPASFLFAVALALVPFQPPLPATASRSPDSTTRARHWLGPSRLGLLPGSVLPFLRESRRIGSLPAERRLGLTLSFRGRNTAALLRYLHAIYDPRSPLFHHFLTPEQFAARYAPTPPQRQQVSAWLVRQGFQVVTRYRNGLGLTVRGSVGAAERAFSTMLALYRRGSSTFYANASALRMPVSILNVVQAVAGVDDAGTMRPALLRRPAAVSPRGLRPHQAFSGYSPADFWDMYDFRPLYQNQLDGTGKTLALVEFGNYNDANIRAFDAGWKVGSPTQRILINDGSSTGAPIDNTEGEVELDIEVGHEISSARVNVYIVSNHTRNWVPLLSQIASDNPEVVSASYGLPESEWAPSLVWAVDALLREMAAQGESVFMASGDAGAFAAADASHPNPKQKQLLVVQYPTSDPWITSVGGTSLFQDSNGSYGSEQVWSSTSDSSGSGGGLSRFFPQPDWQQGPGVTNQYSNGARQIPDVSADADPGTGYSVYSVDNNGNAGWQVYGGTSAAAPLWAAFATIADQALGVRLGFFNPLLYALGQVGDRLQFAPFHDVTQGNNLYYPATPGWDFATGWGSLDA
ncbi:MAG TPA: S53 family peptidase, partial [Chloroflexota bacterium]|nr:S53 family peptidase [Chloroflexota bacterium]